MLPVLKSTPALCHTTYNVSLDEEFIPIEHEYIPVETCPPVTWLLPSYNSCLEADGEESSDEPEYKLTSIFPVPTYGISTSRPLMKLYKYSVFKLSLAGASELLK